MTHSERILLIQSSLHPSLPSPLLPGLTSLGGLDSQGSVHHPASLDGGGPAGSVAKLQEVLELTMWFPVGEAPGSSAGRAVKAKWTLRPTLQSLWRVFLQPPFPPSPPILPPPPPPRLTLTGRGLAEAHGLQGLWTQSGTSPAPQTWCLSQGSPLAASAHCRGMTC